MSKESHCDVLNLSFCNFKTWKLFEEGRSLEIVDPDLSGAWDAGDAAMCVQLGLLCCQAFVFESDVSPLN